MANPLLWSVANEHREGDRKSEDPRLAACVQLRAETDQILAGYSETNTV